LFADPLQRRAFKALASAGSLHDAISHADDEVARSSSWPTRIPRSGPIRSSWP
jgi:hypothetical protein